MNESMSQSVSPVQTNILVTSLLFRLNLHFGLIFDGDADMESGSLIKFDYFRGRRVDGVMAM